MSDLAALAAEEIGVGGQVDGGEDAGEEVAAEPGAVDDDGADEDAGSDAAGGSDAADSDAGVGSDAADSDAGDEAAAEEDESEDAGPAVRRKRQRKRVDLDEDDYDLLEENTGRKFERRDEPSGFKRLAKRARETGEGGGEEGDGEGVADDETARRQIEQQLFDDDDDADDADADGAADEPARPARDAEIGSDDDDDDDDGFIVDEEGRAVKIDEPEDDNMAEVEEAHDIFGTAEELAELLALTKHRGAAAADEPAGGDADARGDSRGLADDGEDDDDDDGDLEGFEVDEEGDEDDEDKAERRRVHQAERLARRRAARSAKRAARSSAAGSRLLKLYPPSMLAERFMLPADEVVRSVDVPERLQARAEGRAPPGDGELRAEAEWIVRECGDGWLRAAADARAPPPSAVALASLVPAVERSLACMRVELLEVPTIAAYRKDESHPLAEPWLWDVSDCDERWQRLCARRAELRAQWARECERLGLGGAEAGAFAALLERADDDAALADLADYLAVRQGVSLHGAGALAHPAAAAAATSALAASGAGKPVRHGLLVAAQRAGVDVLAAQLGLSSEHFATNLRDGWATHSLDEPIDTAEGAAEAFMAAALEQHGGKPPPGLPSGHASDALAAMRELAANQLATEPSVRAYVREYVLERALITVELTAKGDKEVDGAHAHAALRAYRGEPLRALLRAKPTADRPVPPAPLPPAEREAALLRYTRAKRAEAEGFALVKIALPEYGSLERDELYAEFLRAYCTNNDAALPDHDPDGACRQSWSVQRYMMLERALTGLLYERVGRQLEARLAAEAQRALVRACQAAFDAMLAAARPLRDRELRERRPLQRDAFSARSPVVAACKDPNSTSVLFAKLSADGELVDLFRSEWLHVSARRHPHTGDWRTRSAADRARKLEELKRLGAFLAPEEAAEVPFVVLGASHLRVREIRLELEALARALAVRAQEGDVAFDAYNECAHPLGRIEFVDGPLGVDKVRREPLHDARPPSAISLAEMDAAAPFRVVYASEMVPALYAASDAAPLELGERHPLLWRAVSLGRMAQDAVVELAHVCGPTGAGLGALYVHPLQGAMPRDALVQALRDRLCSWVSHLGVRLPWAVAHGSQARHVLQYVPGLGARKGAWLFSQLASLAAAARDVGNRAELVERALLGPRVYANAAPFVFFAPVAAGGGGSLRDANADLEIEPTLEITRVHPEHYEYAYQLCTQAAADEEADVLPAVEDAVRAMIGNREALQQLELSEYARFLRGEEMEGTEPLPEDERRELELQLEFIRQALIDPFTDPRPPICDGTPELPLGGGLTDQYGVALLPTFPELLSGDALFEQLTGETRESLASGLLVAKAIRTGSRERVPGMWCSLESGMQAFLPAEAMTDVPREMAPEEYPIVAGQTFHCAVLSPSDVDTLKFECVVSCRPDDLARADFRSVAEQRAHNERPTGPKLLKRRITHPLFQNVLFEKAVEILKQGAPGDVLFRPSSKGADHLTMSWVWAEGVIVHIDVLERDKPSADSLGKTLLVGYQEGRSDGEAFEALDEIHARYAAPVSDLVSEAMAHRKFWHRKQGEVDALVKKEKADAPASIPYRVSICERMPGNLTLSYVPSKSVKHELVSVKPAGFRLRGVVHTSLDEMLTWFKRNWQVAPLPPDRRPPPPPAPPPVSSWPRQEHVSGWDTMGNQAAANARANAQAASNFLGGLMS